MLCGSSQSKAVCLGKGTTIPLLCYIESLGMDHPPNVLTHHQALPWETLGLFMLSYLERVITIKWEMVN